MQLPRPWFTVRQLMVAVAIVGLLMGGAVQVGVLRRRAALYREEAQEHAGLEKLFREMRNGFGRTHVEISPGSGLSWKTFPIGIAIDHEVKLKRKYERAARYPWLPVTPDPPMPEGRPIPLAPPK